MALSSTVPVGFPLSRTAPGSGFDLLALRARCKREASRSRGGLQGRRARSSRNLRELPQRQGEIAVAAVHYKGSDQKFTEPVALSSTVPGNRRLPPRALGSGFDLLTLRARCRKNVANWDRSNQEGRGAKTPLFARWRWGNPVDHAGSSELKRRKRACTSCSAATSAAIRGVITIR